MSRDRGAGFGLSQAAPSWAAGTLLAAPDRTSTWSPVQLAREAFANFAWFFGAALLVAVLLRRWLTLISTRNAEAMRQAAELSHEAHWRALTVDVFGPVLELLDGPATVGDAVPAQFRREAERLILYRFRTRRRCCGLRFGRMNWLRQDRGLCPFACST